MDGANGEGIERLVSGSGQEKRLEISRIELREFQLGFKAYFGVVVVGARAATDLDPASVLRMRHDRTKNILPSPGRRHRRRG